MWPPARFQVVEAPLGRRAQVIVRVLGRASAILTGSPVAARRLVIGLTESVGRLAESSGGFGGRADRLAEGSAFRGRDPEHGLEVPGVWHAQRVGGVSATVEGTSTRASHSPPDASCPRAL